MYYMMLVVKQQQDSLSSGVGDSEYKPRYCILNDGLPVLLKVFILLCALILFILTSWSYWPYMDTPTIMSRVFQQRFHTDRCPDVMTGITQGAWVTRPLSKDEETTIHTFLITARSHYRVSASLERSDKRCGNVGFPGLHSHAALKFRALCNPLGKTPCCHNFKCVDKSMEACSCPSCFDVRQQIHAEYATWQPKDSRCSFKNNTASRACQLLARSKLYFIGDSYVRQMYIMMVMHLTGNYRDAVLLPNIRTSIRKLYTGPFQLLCNDYLNKVKTVCNQTLLFNHENVTPDQGRYVQRLVHALRYTNKSVVLLGQGIHANYHGPSTWIRFLRPVLNIFNRTHQDWPKLVWVSPHAHGILKMPRYSQQSDESLAKFNSFINGKLRERNVAVFDTFPMTNGVMAFDGAHYGLGVNMAKIQVIYNYIEDLLDKGVW